MSKRLEEQPDDSRVEELIAGYFARAESGEVVSAEELLAECSSDDERRECRELVDLWGEVRGDLPRTPREGLVLADRYVLKEPLGSGGMGEVWTADDRSLGRDVAIKFLRGGTAKPETREFFERERTALARLSHPGIVGIRDAQLREEPAFLVVDRIEGRSLDDVLRAMRESCGLGTAAATEPTPAGLEDAIGRTASAGRGDLFDRRSYPRTVAKIMVELLRTLEAAHDEKILHRDIKPANIMITGGGHPVLLDFGLAAAREDQAGMLTERLFGTANYIAPEQVTSQKAGKDPRTDLYQAGLVLFAMLTLEDAFAADSDETLQLIEDGKVRSAQATRAAVPWELDRICATALAKDPGARFATARVFREELERYLGGRELPLVCRNEAGGAARSHKLLYFARRRWVVMLVAAAVLVAVVPLALMGATLEVKIAIVDRTRDRIDLEIESSAAGFVVLFPEHPEGLSPVARDGVEGAERWVIPVAAGMNRTSVVSTHGASAEDLELRPLASRDRERLVKASDALQLVDKWLGVEEPRVAAPPEEARKICQSLEQTSRGPAEAGGKYYNALTVDQLLGDAPLGDSGVVQVIVR